MLILITFLCVSLCTHTMQITTNISGAIDASAHQTVDDIDTLSHLDDALLTNNIQAVRTILKHKVDLNCLHNGTCALHKAIFCNASVDIVQLLLENNANPNMPSRSGITPLSLAVLCNVQNVDLLQKKNLTGSYVDLLMQYNAHDHKHAALEQAYYNHTFYPNTISAAIVDTLIAHNSEASKKHLEHYITKNPLFNDIRIPYLLEKQTSCPMLVNNLSTK